jgi:antitoxin VapB
MVELWLKGVILALNLKSAEVDRLASEVARLAGESKTEAVRKALAERKARLTAGVRTQSRSERAAGILREFRASVPAEILGQRMSRELEDEILGYGPGGV